MKSITISSLKGGTGKSTFTFLLGKYLSKKFNVAIFDADISSSSFSEFSGVSFAENSLTIENNRIIPYLWQHNGETNPISVVCVSQLVGSNASVVGEQMNQFIEDVIHFTNWNYHSEIDYLLVDCPAGLGDIYLTLTNNLIRQKKIHLGDIVISIPSQKFALEKILEFTQRKSKILGVVTNLSGFICPECGEKYDIFGDKKVIESLAEKYDSEFLGTIPISLDFCRKQNGGILPEEVPEEFAEVFTKTEEKIKTAKVVDKKIINTKKSNLRKALQKKLAQILIDLFVFSNENLNIPSIYRNFPESNSVKLKILDEDLDVLNTIHLRVGEDKLKVLKNEKEADFEIYLTFRTFARIILQKWKDDTGKTYPYNAILAWRNRDIEIVGEGSTTKMVQFFNAVLSDEVITSLIQKRASILRGWI